MRTFNLRLVLWLAGIFLAVAVGVHFLHGYMVRKNALIYLQVAKEQEQIARDKDKLWSERTKAAESAMRNYRRYLAFVPDETAERAEYGKFLMDHGAPALAYGQFERVLREDEENDEIRRLQLDLAIRGRVYADAERHLDILLAKHEDDAELQEKKGRVLVDNEKDRQVARKCFERAIALAPDRLTAYVALADLDRLYLNNATGARETIDRMVAANPDNAEAFVLRAKFLLRDTDLDAGRQKERLEQATTDCNTALEKKPDDVDARKSAAICAMRQQDYDTARQHLIEAIALEKELENPSPDLYINLASVEQQAAQSDPQAGREASIRVYREGLAAIPDNDRNFELRWRLAEQLISTRPDSPVDAEAVAEARRIREELRHDRQLSPGDLAVVDYLDARQLYRDQQWYEVRRLLEELRTKLGDRPQLLQVADMMLTSCYARLGDQDQRLTAARRVLDRNPLNRAVRQDYANALAAVGRYSEAVQEYAQVVDAYDAKLPFSVLQSYISVLSNDMASRPKGEQKWDSVTGKLDEYTQKHPEFAKEPALPIMYAEIKLNMDDIEGAKQALENADPSVAEDRRVILALVEVEVKAGDFDAAAQRLTALEEKQGDSADLRAIKASLLIAQKGKEGLPELAKLVEGSEKFTNEERAQLYWQLALLCRAHDEALALQYGQQATTFVPNALTVRLQLLALAQSARAVELATRLADEIAAIERGRAASTDPATAGAVTLYAQALADMTRYAASLPAPQPGEQASGSQAPDQKAPDRKVLEDARTKLLDAQQKRPTWRLVPLLLGEIAAIEGQHGAALAYYQRAMELGDRDISVIGRVAGLLSYLGRNDEAMQVISLLSEQRAKPGAPLAYLASQISFSGGDLARAEEYAQMLLQSGTPQTVYDVWMSQLHAEREDMVGALEQAKVATDRHPQDGMAWTNRVRMLVGAAAKATKEAEATGNADEAAGKKQQAEAWLAEAASVMAEAEQHVESTQRVQTVAECLRLLGRLDEALARYRDALAASAQPDPALMEAAARFYLEHQGLWPEAAVILQQFVDRKVAVGDDSVTWARRSLAQIRSGDLSFSAFLESLKLVDTNLEQNPKSLADLQLRASLLASRNLPSTQKEAVRILEQLDSADVPKDIDRDFQLGQLYLSLGEWVKASDRLSHVVMDGGNSPNYARYLDAYINALLDHYDASAAQLWLDRLKEKEPKAIGTYLLEARTMLPKSRPEADAVVPAWDLDKALSLLDRAVNDPEIQVGGPADQTPEQRRLLKMGLVIRTLEDLLEEAARKRTGTTDYDGLKQVLDRYFAQIIEADPQTYQLVHVPYLVRQGERRKALELVRQHWADAPLQTLLPACSALLHTKAELKRIRRLDPQPDAAALAQLQADVQADAEETASMLRQATIGKQQELTGAVEEREKNRLTLETITMLTLLASHSVNSERYEEAIGLYTEVLKLQPTNAAALNNRAMIQASLAQNLDQALSQITQAIDLVGPQPTFVDSRAMILLADGKKQEALVSAKRVMSEKPPNLDPAVNEDLAKQWGGYYFHLAWISDANGDNAGALAAMQEAKQLGFGADDVFKLELPAWNRLVTKLGI